MTRVLCRLNFHKWHPTAVFFGIFDEACQRCGKTRRAAQWVDEAKR